LLEPPVRSSTDQWLIARKRASQGIGEMYRGKGTVVSSQAALLTHRQSELT
jgi:hypothetical protein